MSILDDISVLDLALQAGYRQLIVSTHLQTVDALNRMSQAEWLLLGAARGVSPVDLLGDKPSECEEQVRKDLEDKTAYTLLEEDLLQKLKEIQDENTAYILIGELVCELEEIFPLEIEEGAALAFFKNREKIVSILGGREIEEFHTQFSNASNVPALVDVLARHAYWNTLAFRLKEGAARYPKRQMRTIHAFCDAVTEYRLLLIEQNQLSPILDQTGYDLPEKREVEDITLDHIANAIDGHISDEFNEYFDGKLSVPELLIACIGTVHQMGVKDVCLIHHYPE